MTFTNRFHSRPTASTPDCPTWANYSRRTTLVKELLEAGYSESESIKAAWTDCPCGTQEPTLYTVDGVRVCSDCHGKEFADTWD